MCCPGGLLGRNQSSKAHLKGWHLFQSCTITRIANMSPAVCCLLDSQATGYMLSSCPGQHLQRPKVPRSLVSICRMRGIWPDTVCTLQDLFPLIASVLCPHPTQCTRLCVVREVALSKALNNEGIPRMLCTQPWALSLSFCICKVHRSYKSFMALYVAMMPRT